MTKLMTTGSLALAGVVATGLIAWQAPGASADSEAFKREDDSQAVVTTVDDDDDNDTGDRTRGGNTSGVSRDRDRSRGGGTRDFTNDGPGKHNRDWSQNRTNDRSRHDTRR